MDSDFESIYERAERLYDDKKYEEAEKIYLDLLGRSPHGYADIFNKLGLIANQRGRLEDAARYFRKAINLNPQYTEASLNLIVTYNDMGKFEDARQVFSKATTVARSGETTIDPYIMGKLANEHSKLGDQYRILGLQKEALEEYNKALALKPGLVDVITKIGAIKMEEGLLDEAVNLFLMAKDKNPKYIPVFINLGITYYKKGLLDKALKEWGKAKEIDPSVREVEVYLSLARREKRP